MGSRSASLEPAECHGESAAGSSWRWARERRGHLVVARLSELPFLRVAACGLEVRPGLVRVAALAFDLAARGVGSRRPCAAA